MDGFVGGNKDEKTMYGFLDMGGASTQIAFEPADGGSDVVESGAVLVERLVEAVGREGDQAQGVCDDVVGVRDESGEGAVCHRHYLIPPILMIIMSECVTIICN